MPKTIDLLTTVDATYRNTYSIKQKVEWMDITQRQIFQKVKHDAIPWYWVTESGEAYYPLPDNCDVMGINQVTIETKSGSDKYRKLPFMSIQSTDYLTNKSEFYSLLDRTLFLNPEPTTETEGKKIFLYYSKRPAPLNYNDLEQIPDLNEDFQELLVLGCLERIARARGETEDKDNFAADFNILLREYEKQYMRSQPGYSKVLDTMKPKRRGAVFTRGRREDYSMVPDDLLN